MFIFWVYSELQVIHSSFGFCFELYSFIYVLYFVFYLCVLFLSSFFTFGMVLFCHFVIFALAIAYLILIVFLFSPDSSNHLPDIYL